MGAPGVLFRTPLLRVGDKGRGADRSLLCYVVSTDRLAWQWRVGLQEFSRPTVGVRTVARAGSLENPNQPGLRVGQSPFHFQRGVFEELLSVHLRTGVTERCSLRLQSR